MAFEDVWEQEKIGIAILSAAILMLCFNRAHKYLPFLKCWRTDESAHEAEHCTLRYIPDTIDYLISITKFDKSELRMLYRNFKNECPNGVVNEETFKSIYGQFFPDGDSDSYARLVFHAFDQCDEGHVNFQSFAVGLSRLLRGSLQDRLTWVFHLYDFNRNGYVTKEDLTRIVRSVYWLLGNNVHPPITDSHVAHHATRVFDKLDRRHTGHVTIDDFCHSCSKDESIVKSMSVFDNAI